MSGTRLSEIAQPGTFRCVSVDCVGNAMIRLKRLGICGDRLIEVIQPGDPMVLKVVGSRLGVSRQLAEFVVVDRIVDGAASGEADTVEHA